MFYFSQFRIFKWPIWSITFLKQSMPKITHIQTGRQRSAAAIDSQTAMEEDNWNVTNAQEDDPIGQAAPGDLLFNLAHDELWVHTSPARHMKL